eukprot:IDg4535t1
MHYYWLSLAASCCETVSSYAACAKERIRIQANSNPLKFFSPSGPLEDIAIDLLSELTQTRRVNKFLLVIVDRYTKLVKTIPLCRITALVIFKAFTTHWAFVYGVSKSVLTDNGPHSSTRYLPFEQALSPMPPNLTIEDYTPPVKSLKEVLKHWLIRLRSHMKKAGKALQQAQARYKRNYDQKFRKRRKILEPGGYAFLR